MRKRKERDELKTKRNKEQNKINKTMRKRKKRDELKTKRNKE